MWGRKLQMKHPKLWSPTTVISNFLSTINVFNPLSLWGENLLSACCSKLCKWMRTLTPLSYDVMLIRSHQFSPLPLVSSTHTHLLIGALVSKQIQETRLKTQEWLVCVCTCVRACIKVRHILESRQNYRDVCLLLKVVHPWTGCVSNPILLTFTHVWSNKIHC